MSTDTAELNPTIDFLAGTAGGIAGLVVGFPFDTVKVRFQSPSVASKYNSTLHAVTTIIREERFRGLYKGITSPLATVALMNGLVFASYRFLMKIQLDSPDSIPSLAQIALAGAGSGIVSSIVTTPTELIKIRQQASLTPTSARKIALDIIKESGIRGLYRGITATALRDCGYGAYFFAYEATCRYLTPSARDISDSTSELSALVMQVDHQPAAPSWSTLLLAGGVAGVAGWLATFPIDVVKTRVQASSGSSYILGQMQVSPSSAPLLSSSTSSSGYVTDAQRAINPYRTTLSTVINSYRAEGLGVFFRGLAPTLIRAIPVNMVTFAVFETIVHAFS